jgi:Lon protease-like protein
MASDDALIPLFPLPNVVFFPQTVLPLHVFEPRYRALVRDVRAGGGRFAVVLLRPGFESEYERRPPIHAVGTVGRIDRLTELADGRFELSLIGVRRAVLHEVSSDLPYRLARAEWRPERSDASSEDEIEGARLSLLASASLLARELGDGESAPLPLHDGMPFSAVVNGCCANLPIEPESRQRLLEIDDLGERARHATEILDRLVAGLLRLREGDPGGAGQPN